MQLPGCPNSTEWNWRRTSDADDAYNCFAHAMHDKDHYIWPDPQNQFSWPPNRNRIDSVDCIKDFLQSLGFVQCPGDNFEPTFQKVAVYARDGFPEHLARQKLNGKWSSKLAESIDIEHDTLNVLAGGRLGAVVLIMKRVWNGLYKNSNHLTVAARGMV